jgi:tetratricopeptide (TPR) repeat protein
MGMPKLVLSYDGTTYEISSQDTPYTIGRLPENLLCINHDVVSASHARIVFRDNGFVFEDLNSTNGSVVCISHGNESILQGKSIFLSERGSIRFGRTGPAITYFVRDNSQNEKDNLDELMKTGLPYLESEDYGSALAEFENLISKHPHFVPAYYYAGFAAAGSGELQTAILRFEQYLTLRADDTNVLVDLGKVYERTGDLAKASNCYRRALQARPGNREAETRMKEVTRFQPSSLKAVPKKTTRDLLGGSSVSFVTVDPFRVSYNLSDHGRVLTDVMKALKSAWQEVGDLLNYFPAAQVPVYLRRPLEDVSGRTGPDGIILEVDEAHLGEKPFLTVLVTHEYAHYVLGLVTGFSRKVPWWLQEGFAQNVSQTITPLRLYPLRVLTEADRLFPLKVLEADLSDIKDRDAVNIAYIEAETAVAFLIKRRGREGLRALIEALSTGEKIQSAFRCAGWDYGDFEKEWSLWLARSTESGRVRLTREL